MTTCAVVIASAGRPEMLGDLLAELTSQSQPPVEVCVSVPTEHDLPVDLVERPPFRLHVVVGTRGLPAQRNAGVRALTEDCDVIAFVDDDLVPSSTFVESIQQAFARDADLIGASGWLRADGVVEGELTREDGRARLGDGRPAPVDVDLDHLYGCNMCVRGWVARQVPFDERLPLYGWLEDLDFSRRVASYGRLRRVHTIEAVHLGARSGGRTQHRRLGYSQLVNPVYLARKGSIRWRELFYLAVMPIFKNMLLTPWTGDRRRRVAGNLIGLSDVLRGRVTPERAARL